MKIVYVKLEKDICVAYNFWKQLLQSGAETEVIRIEAYIKDPEGNKSLYPAGEKAELASLAENISKICLGESVSVVLLEDTAYNRKLAAKIAVCMKARCLPEVVEILRQGEQRCFVREVYQANMYAAYSQDDTPVIITVKKQEKEYLENIFSDAAIKICVNESIPEDVRTRKKMAVGIPLFQEETILICGHGVGNRQNTEEIVRIAGKLGFGVGATRPVVTSGWLSSGYLVGISGTCISPARCIVLGASGSQAFMAGIKDSGMIIAVNTDQSASVFKKCDVGIIGDCMDFVRRLVER